MKYTVRQRVVATLIQDVEGPEGLSERIAAEATVEAIKRGDDRLVSGEELEARLADIGTAEDK
jgi:hypothetical protein